MQALRFACRWVPFPPAGSSRVLIWVATVSQCAQQGAFSTAKGSAGLKKPAGPTFPLPFVPENMVPYYPRGNAIACRLTRDPAMLTQGIELANTP